LNIVVVNVFKRPWHTRLCLEALARAQRWSRGWADEIAICLATNAHEHPRVIEESNGVVERNADIPFRLWQAPDTISSNPHAMSKWMLDKAFAGGADIALYVEDDAIIAPDGFLLCERTKQMTDAGNVLGCCLYHETIPQQYRAENRSPDASLLHLGNGLNTCGGTAFLREPYLRYLSPGWNCKQVEPRGFDYSAHYLMYVHGLYMLWPDYSRSANYGFSGGSLQEPEWAKYFGKSITVTEHEALRAWQGFHVSCDEPRLVRESWMDAELALQEAAQAAAQAAAGQGGV
jgi:hypothetical protein